MRWRHSILVGPTVLLTPDMPTILVGLTAQEMLVGLIRPNMHIMQIVQVVQVMQVVQVGHVVQVGQVMQNVHTHPNMRIIYNAIADVEVQLLSVIVI